MKAFLVILAANIGVALYGLLLLLAGPVVLLITAVACFIWCIAYLSRLERRPVSDEERALARADVELSRAEAEARMCRRLARQRAREGSSIRSGGGFR